MQSEKETFFLKSFSLIASLRVQENTISSKYAWVRFFIAHPYRSAEQAQD